MIDHEWEEYKAQQDRFRWQREKEKKRSSSIIFCLMFLPLWPLALALIVEYTCQDIADWWRSK